MSLVSPSGSQPLAESPYCLENSCEFLPRTCFRCSAVTPLWELPLLNTFFFFCTSRGKRRNFCWKQDEPNRESHWGFAVSLSWLGHCVCDQKVAGLIPSRVTIGSLSIALNPLSLQRLSDSALSKLSTPFWIKASAKKL